MCALDISLSPQDAVKDLIAEGQPVDMEATREFIEQILENVALTELRDVEDELLGYCRDNDIGVVAYSPMQKGLLTGKFSAERVANLAPDDHRCRDRNFLEPKLGANLKLVEGLGPIAQRNGLTLAQLAIAWVLRRKEVTAAIVGARRPGQIAETISAAEGALGGEDLAEIEGLLAQQGEKRRS